jgi:hypothetical protein
MKLKIGIILLLVILSFSVMGFWGFGGDKGVNDIIKLLKANVGEELIKAHIEKKEMVFDLTTEDILNLKKAGASDKLLAFMMGINGNSDFPFIVDDNFIVKKPAKHNHLTIYPVYREIEVDVEDYLTLDEAQKTNIIEISEKPNASVPSVTIRNNGGKHIFIMAGEIILGGKQDRMISFDVLIPPGKEMDVEVKCVEHGRWHGKSKKFKTGSALGSKGVRSALQFKGQQEVWNEVSKACAQNSALSESGTYKAILSSQEVEKKSKPYLNAMNKQLNHKNMAGMIMALNGEIVCLDIFENPTYFSKVKDKLIKAYVLDAISTEIVNTDSPDKDDIIKFFKELEVAKAQELKRYNANCNTELESDAIIGNESRDSEGRLQHLNIYKR